jgi:hypothetical protein
MTLIMNGSAGTSSVVFQSKSRRLTSRMATTMAALVVAASQTLVANAEWISLPVTNSQFETAEGITGWTRGWSANSGWDTPNAPGSTGGSAYMGGAGLTQTLTPTVAANTDYRITVANYVYSPTAGAKMQFGMYLGGQQFWTDYVAPTQSPGTWADYSLTVTAAQISPASIGGAIKPAIYGDTWTYFDNVRVEAQVVPEPSAAILLLTAVGAGCAAWRQRRSRRT